MSLPISVEISQKFPSQAANACQLVFLYDDAKLKGGAKKINDASDGLIKRLFSDQDFIAHVGDTLLLHACKGSAAQRVLLIGLGDRQTVSRTVFRKACAAAARVLLGTPSQHG